VAATRTLITAQLAFFARIVLPFTDLAPAYACLPMRHHRAGRGSSEGGNSVAVCSRIRNSGQALHRGRPDASAPPLPSEKIDRETRLMITAAQQDKEEAFAVERWFYRQFPPGCLVGELCCSGGGFRSSVHGCSLGMSRSPVSIQAARRCSASA